MNVLPYIQASELAEDEGARRWLVDGLWGDGAVGILGCEPKCCKSFLALELAVAVASGVPCLGRFSVSDPGPVLLFAAEDAPRIVKSRLNGIAEARGAEFRSLCIQVITSEKLRLDEQSDVDALEATVAELRPRLVILDPFVRLHRIDENSSAEVAKVLENLRLMQKRHKTSVLIVHHAKKGGGTARAGQALRGSSEFHAWGDSNLYMRRRSERLTLTVEHRAAAAPAAIPLSLRGTGDSVALEIELLTQAEPEAGQTRPTAAARIEKALSGSPGPLSVSAIRQACGLRTETLCDALREMLESGRVCRIKDGYALSN